MEVDNVTLNLLMAVIQQENEIQLTDSEVGRRVMENHPQQVLVLIERCVHIWRDNAGKTYYRALPSGAPVPSENRYILYTHASFEWVADSKNATSDYREPVEATQAELKKQLNIDTELVAIGEQFVLRRKVR